MNIMKFDQTLKIYVDTLFLLVILELIKTANPECFTCKEPRYDFKSKTFETIKIQLTQV